MVTEHRAAKGSAGYVTLSPIRLDKKATEDAKAAAKIWMEKGVILSISWDTGDMKATNEVAAFSLRASSLDWENYALEWEGAFEIGPLSFRTALLTEEVCLLGRPALPSLQGMLRDIEKMVSGTRPDFLARIRNGGLEQPNLVHDFLLRLPVQGGGERVCEQLADAIDSAGFSPGSKRRPLPDLASLSTFQHCLHSFWDQAGEQERLVYYPVFLWWEVTGLIPTRPMEFLVTPFDCLRMSADGGWYLTLRKSRLKGTDAPKGYNIREDYMLKEYRVSERTAKIILDYQDAVRSRGLSPCSLGTLLVHGLARDDARDGFYSYPAFNSLLRRFQEEAVAGRYGFTLIEPTVSRKSVGANGETQLVRPGDSRHVAIINAVSEGVPIETAMEMAHHANVNQTCWYAANISSYARSAVALAYDEWIRRDEPPIILPTWPVADGTENAPFLELDFGRCYSPRLSQEEPDAYDCVQSMGPNGELGWCPKCSYFRSEGPGLEGFDPKRLVYQAYRDWGMFLDMIDLYKKNVLHEDSLAAALKKAQAGVSILKDLLERSNIKKGDDADGKAPAVQR